MNSPRLIPALSNLYCGICRYFSNSAGPGGLRQRRHDAGDRLPFGDRQTGQGQPGDPADHDHQENHRAAQRQPIGDRALAGFGRVRRMWPSRPERESPAPASVFIPDIVVGYKCRREFTAFTGIASRVSLPRPLRTDNAGPEAILSRNPGESRDLFDNPEADRWTPASAGVAVRLWLQQLAGISPPARCPAGRLAQ